jgi:hypothetical protein
VQKFFRSNSEFDNHRAEEYAAFIYALFRAARVLFEPVKGTEYSVLASALYELFSKDQSSATTPPPLRAKFYDAVVLEARVR